jgi:hypothetical protein
VSGSGSFKVEVFETKTTYYNKVVDEEFKDVMHWKMTKSGFDGIPMTTGLLFESMEFFWNTRPLMIPKVIVRGELGDLISNSDPAASEQTNDLVGVLTINLTIKDYDFDGE